MKKAASILSVLLSLTSVAAQAGVQATGPEIHTGSCPECNKKIPSVAGAKTGDFAVVWEGSTRTDPKAVLARFYTKAGAARGAQVQVNKLVAPDQYDAAVTVDTAGNTIVAWSELANDNSEIFVQRYNSKAKALGAAIKVNVDDPAAPATPLDVFPSLAPTPDGGFVVAWILAVPPNASDRIPPVLMYRSYNKNAAPLTAPIQLNTGLVRGIRPDVCVSSKTGQAVVAWTSVDGF